MQFDDAYLEAAIRLGFLDEVQAQALVDEWRGEDPGAARDLREFLLERRRLDPSRDQAVLAALQSHPRTDEETSWTDPGRAIAIGEAGPPRREGGAPARPPASGPASGVTATSGAGRPGPVRSSPPTEQDFELDEDLTALRDPADEPVAARASSPPTSDFDLEADVRVPTEDEDDLTVAWDPTSAGPVAGRASPPSSDFDLEADLIVPTEDVDRSSLLVDDGERTVDFDPLAEDDSGEATVTLDSSVPPDRPQWLKDAPPTRRTGPVAIPMPGHKPDEGGPAPGPIPGPGPAPARTTGPIPTPGPARTTPAAGSASARPAPPAPGPMPARPGPPVPGPARSIPPAPAPGPRPAVPAAKAGPAPGPPVPKAALARPSSSADATATFDPLAGPGTRKDRTGSSARPATGSTTGGAVQVTGPDLLFAGVSMKYEMGKVLGRGGMGEVLLAIDRFLRRNVAIKTLIAAEKPGAEAKFLQEARYTGQLEHPNIVPVHEIGKDPDGRPYMVMKRIKGRSLRDILRSLSEGKPSGLGFEDGEASTGGGSRTVAGGAALSRSGPGRARRRPGGGPTAPGLRRASAGTERRQVSIDDDPTLVLNRLLEIFKKVCDAVAYAHSRNIIHRDIKPANIMVGEFGEVQLMDWGIAKRVGEAEAGAADEPVAPAGDDGLATAYGVVKGTPAYMAPEQAMGKVDAIDPRSDVYALGGLLYSILTLLPPVERGGAQEMLLAVSRGQIVPPSKRTPDREIPSELEAVVLKAMHVDPDRRYQSALELEADIDAWLHGRMLGAARYSFWTVFLKWARRNRRKIAGISVGLVATVASLFLGVYGLMSAIEGSRVEEARLALKNQEARVQAEEQERKKTLEKALRERRTEAESLFAAGVEGLEEARRVAPFNPGAPQPYFQRVLPAILRLAQAIQTHPSAPAGWRDRLAAACDEVQRRAETVGDWALVEHMAQAAVLWGAVDAPEGARRAERARGARVAVEEEDRRRLDDVLSRIGEAEKAR